MTSHSLVDQLFPVEDRKKLLKKSNIVFKADLDDVLRFWRLHADPLRGTLIRTHTGFIIVNHDDPDIIHVTNMVRYLIYKEYSDVTVITEKTLRILARGILYHILFSKKFGASTKALFEFPVTCSVNGYVVVGNIDVVIPTPDGFYIVELKSSSTENTVNYGFLQVKIYWSMLKNFLNIPVKKAYVLTPNVSFEVDRPLMKREVKRLVMTYILLKASHFRAGMM